MKNRAILYARLSREDEDKLDGVKTDSRSIQNQIKLLEEYANKKEFTVYKIYYDDGYSGEDFNRPGLSCVLEDASQRKFDVLLIKDFSRLGRVMHRVGNLLENVFPSYGIRVISIEDNYDSGVYESDEPVILKNFLNEYYLKEFKRKMKTVRMHIAHTKHMNYYPKFGYNFDGEGKEIVDLYAAHVVQRIFDWIAEEEKSTCQVAKLLNDEQIPTRSYYATKVLGLKALHKNVNNQWTAEKVWEIAKDYEYCGHSVNLVRSKEDRIVLKNTHKAIIEESVYWKAQEIIGKHTKSENRLNHIASLLYDKKMRKRLFYERGNGKACYFFRAENKRVYKIEATKLENILYRDILYLIEGCKTDSETIRKQLETNLFGNAEYNVDKLKKKLQKSNELYMDLLERLFAQKVSQSMFDKDSALLRQMITDIEKRVETSSKRDEEITRWEKRFIRFMDEIETFPLDKIELIKRVIDRVYIEKKTEKKWAFDIRYKI